MSDSIETFEASRRRLLSIAYRMLGSMAEAEDVVQETWLRWHGARPEALATPVAWLTTVTTRLAIDRLRRLQRERAAEGHWLPEPWLVDAPSAEDTVSRLCELSYGVLLLLERLSPDERAALLLHEVFDCSHDEIARTLGRKVEHSRQLVRRARERVRTGPARRPARDGGAALARKFVEAIRAQDKAAMIQLLAPAVVLAGDVAATGLTAVAAALLRSTAGMACRLAGVNGGWGVMLRLGRIELALSLELDGDAVAAVYAVAPRRLAVMA